MSYVARTMWYVSKWRDETPFQLGSWETSSAHSVHSFDKLGFETEIALILRVIGSDHQAKPPRRTLYVLGKTPVSRAVSLAGSR